MNWWWFVLAWLAGSGAAWLFIYASTRHSGEWRPAKPDENSIVLGTYSNFIAPEAELPEGYELPSTAPIPENYPGVKRAELDR